LFDFLERLWIENELARLLLTNIVVVGIYVIAVRLLRKRAGLIHSPFKPQDVRFREAGVSAYSDRTLQAKRGGARHALIVTVLKDALLIEPQRLFKWFIPPGLNDLEYYVKKSDIVSTEPDVLFGRKIVRVRFKSPDHSKRTVTLLISDHEEFLQALKD
jgi:hypothetical protein